MNSRSKLLLQLAGVSNNTPDNKNVISKQNTSEKPVQESSKMNGM